MKTAVKTFLTNRYAHEGELDKSRVTADVLTFGRIPATEYYRYQLANAKRNPNSRTWGFASQVAGLLFTDKIDGWFGKHSQKRRGINDSLAGWGDQLTDKRVVNRLMQQLVDNGEISVEHLTITKARDRMVTAGRVMMELAGIETKAGQLGKAKTAMQSIGILVASSPVHATHPELADQIFTAATALSVVSGSEYLDQLPETAVNIIGAFTHQNEAMIYENLTDLVGSVFAHSDEFAQATWSSTIC